MDEIIELFQKYRAYLGFNDQKYLEKQDEFEEKFCEWICSIKGHDIGPDQCNIPNHDYCYCCGKSVVELELKRSDNWKKDGSYEKRD